jgi:hypothetical protein
MGPQSPDRALRATIRIPKQRREKKNMKKFGFATLAASALAAGFVGLAAPAMAAPTGVSDAQGTISSLEAEGYDVIVNRLSDAPLTQASVVSVSRGQSFTHTVTGANNDDEKLFGPVTKTTVYVNVK